MPAKKHARTTKRARPTAAPGKKKTVEPVAAEPQMVAATVATFEEPFEFVVAASEPVVDVIEVFEITVPDDVGEI